MDHSDRLCRRRRDDPALVVEVVSLTRAGFAGGFEPNSGRIGKDMSWTPRDAAMKAELAALEELRASAVAYADMASPRTLKRLQAAARAYHRAGHQVLDAILTESRERSRDPA